MQTFTQKITPKYNGYQELHVHSTGSYRDAVNTVKEIFDITEKLGRRAVAITDHGNMVRLFEALKERTVREKKVIRNIFTEKGIGEDEINTVLSSMGSFDSIRNPSEKMLPHIKKYEDIFIEAANRIIQFIPGIEAYITDGNNERMHICLYATDWLGTQTLFKLNNRSQLNKSKGFPQLSFDLLEEYVGEGENGHGHVIATSACVAGHLSRILLKPQAIEEKVAELNKKIEKCGGVNPASLSEFEDLLKKTEEKLVKAKEVRNEAKKAVGKDFTGRVEKAKEKLNALNVNLSKCEDSYKRERIESDIAKAAEKLSELEETKRSNDALASSYPEKEKAFSELTIAVKNIKEEIKSIKKQIEPALKLQSQIDVLNAEKSSLGDVYETAKQIALRYNNIFGQGNYYIELQKHGIPDEDYVYPMLLKIAKETGIPLTCANDVHYATAGDKHKRDIIASTRFNQPIEIVANQVGNSELYFKSDEQMKKLFADVPEAIENTSRIAERCNVFYNKEMHLPVFDTKNNLTPIEYLENYARKNIAVRYPDYDSKSEEWKQTLENRLVYELGVIERMGYASYIAIVQDFIRYAKEIGGAEKVGPGRGSAAGSLVCFLTNITDIDPLRYDLLFERFLNPDRVSMPDIDTDFAPSIRNKVVEYIDELYRYKGEYDDLLRNSTCNIYTESVLGGRSAVRSVARVTGVAIEVADRIAKQIPAVPGMTVAKALAEDEEFKKLYASNKEAKKLIDETLLVEGIPDHTSVHAAGIIIADKPVSEYAPLFWSESCNGWVIQCDMVSCEKDIGLLKMDFLILKNLDIISTASTLVKEKKDKNFDITSVNKAEDNAVISRIYAKGDTNGVFQFESAGMKQTLMSFKPACIDDVILLNAAYRPGPQQYIPEITDIKHGKKTPAYLVPEMKDILSVTYSKPIYQEQIQQIFHKIAGFSLGEADIIRRAMSKKHLDELEKYKDKFFEGFRSRNVKDKDIEAFWTELLDFASYAFNKSHSAAYSILSYQTAYLKTYYAAAYMTSLLCYSPLEKIPLYIRNAKDAGVITYNPDVNKSLVNFTLDGDNILFGLGCIKSVKNGATAVIEEREAHGVYKSFKDFIIRACISGIRKSVINCLILSGAMDSICRNRKVYSEILEDYYESCKSVVKKITSKEEVSYEELYNKVSESWVAPVIPNGQNFTKEIALEYEKEYLGYYASGHPLDDKEKLLTANSDTKIAAIDENTDDCVICGRVVKKTLLRRKSDGKEMAKFTLEDLTGEVECICFTREYDKYRGFIEEGSIISVIGKADVETELNPEEETVVISVQVRVVSIKSTANPRNMVINAYLTDYADFIEPFLAKLPQGNMQIVLNDLLCNEMKATTFCVSHINELTSFLNQHKISFAICK